VIQKSTLLYVQYSPLNTPRSAWTRNELVKSQTVKMM